MLHWESAEHLGALLILIIDVVLLQGDSGGIYQTADCVTQQILSMDRTLVQRDSGSLLNTWVRSQLILCTDLPFYRVLQVESAEYLGTLLN